MPSKEKRKSLAHLGGKSRWGLKPVLLRPRAMPSILTTGGASQARGVQVRGTAECRSVSPNLQAENERSIARPQVVRAPATMKDEQQLW